MIEFYQFFELFNTESHIEKGLEPKEIGEQGWKSFYDGLIDLFSIRKSEFAKTLNIDSFLKSVKKSNTGIRIL